MKSVVTAALTLLVLAGAVACGAAPESGAGSEWVVEHDTTEDGTPLVRNVSGSKWGGDATLLEELSIGVLEGADEYMFARTTALWLTDSEIFVLDGANHRIKVYDLEGTFLRQFGNEGDGPGELRFPSSMVVASDGRVMIASGNQGSKIVVFDRGGAYLEEWRANDGTMPAFNLVETPAGFFARTFIMPEKPGDDIRQGIQQVGPEGPIGDTQEIPEHDIERVTMKVTFNVGITRDVPVPYSANNVVWVVLPTGHLAHGFPSRYRFRLREPSGATIAVERVTDPIPITPGEKEQARARAVAMYQRQAPDFSWDGDNMPDTKPWYGLFMADHSGRLWVSREGSGSRVEDCDPSARDPNGVPPTCWQPERLLEVFDLEGSYLGSVSRPDGMSLFAPYIRGDHFVAGVIDDDGAPLVKLFRIVRPSGGEATS